MANLKFESAAERLRAEGERTRDSERTRERETVRWTRSYWIGVIGYWENGTAVFLLHFILDTGTILDQAFHMGATTAVQLKKTLADAIRHRLAEDNMSISAFAKKIRTGRNSVRRLLDGKNTAITLKTMTKAAHALNLELSLAVKQLPLSKLELIAKQYADTSDNKEAAKLEVQFLEGYYGKPVNQLHAKDTAVCS
jgi:transcriptional regulator with XRE-family HTH domain